MISKDWTALSAKTLLKKVSTLNITNDNLMIRTSIYFLKSLEEVIDK